jgi:hypothetical protein
MGGIHIHPPVSRSDRLKKNITKVRKFERRNQKNTAFSCLRHFVVVLLISKNTYSVMVRQQHTPYIFTASRTSAMV